MSTAVSKTEFYRELEASLAASTGEQRKMWATRIIRDDLEIKELAGLLTGEQKVATRFLWLLSDVGILAPEKLLSELPFLFQFCTNLNPVYKNSFASFWMYAGVPVENEGEAIDLLFRILLSNDTTVTIKSRGLFVLAKLAKKYPELKPELKICLEEQMDKYSADFRKRAAKLLTEIAS